MFYKGDDVRERHRREIRFYKADNPRDRHRKESRYMRYIMIEKDRGKNMFVRELMLEAQSGE